MSETIIFLLLWNSTEISESEKQIIDDAKNILGLTVIDISTDPNRKNILTNNSKGIKIDKLPCLLLTNGTTTKTFEATHENINNFKDTLKYLID